MTQLLNEQEKTILLNALPVILKINFLNLLGSALVNKIIDLTYTLSSEELDLIKKTLNSNLPLVNALLKHIPENRFLLEIKNGK